MGIEKKVLIETAKGTVSISPRDFYRKIDTFFDLLTTEICYQKFKQKDNTNIKPFLDVLKYRDKKYGELIPIYKKYFLSKKPEVTSSSDERLYTLAEMAVF